MITGYILAITITISNYDEIKKQKIFYDFRECSTDEKLLRKNVLIKMYDGSYKRRIKINKPCSPIKLDKNQDSKWQVTELKQYNPWEAKK